MTDILRAAVEAAIKAPSSYNAQPWRFHISGEVLEVFADPERQLHAVDGDRRQLIQSCGCALYNARVAIRALGHEPEVTTMLTDAIDPELLATVRVGAPRITTDEDHELLRAIDLRHTNRRAFLARPINSALSDALIEAGTTEGVTMARLEPQQKHVLGVLVDEADRLQYSDPAFRAELARWMIPFGSRRRDGIPFSEKEYGSAFPFAVMRKLRSPDLGDSFGRLEDKLVLGAPAVYVLGTFTDDPSDWLRCGEALEAVLLRATNHGLSAAFLNQVLEVPGLRAEVAELIPGIAFPQMVFRLGVPEEPVHHAAPRRDVSEVLS